MSKSNVTAMPSSGTRSTPTTMKLLVDTASQRVLFAEAGKDVVDFLFGVLAMPVGALASLLRPQDARAGDALGCVANIYTSADKMEPANIYAPVIENSLAVGPSMRPLPTSAAPAPEPAYTYNRYMCMFLEPAPPLGIGVPHPVAPPAPQRAAGRCTRLQPPPPDAGGLLPPFLYSCHACGAPGSVQGSRGFVQAAAIYTVMDDLTVTHASNMSTVALLGRIGVKDLGTLEERTVTVGRKECLEIIKVSLSSKTVLTDVFLDKKKKRTRTAGDEDDEEAATE